MKKIIANEKDGIEVPDICGKVIELLNQDNSNCKYMSIATLFVNPGESSQKHFHKKMEEIYYIIEGEAEIDIDGIINKVYSGHAILIPIGSTHQIKNTGTQILKFISVDSPPFLQEDIFLGN